MKSDIEIANSVKLKKITDIAAKLGDKLEVEQYGHYKAKVNAKEFNENGKLILVTAINPTPMGEGKTTISIGLADALSKLGIKVSLALREPSLGPVFGVKGGAAGGGFAQVAPMEDINLHFTGDLHAITAANNLLSALIDNHIQWGNAEKIKTVTFRRCLDINDRALRNTVVGLGGAVNGVPREDGFDITAASEIMAVLCLASDITDLKKRLGDIAVGSRADGSLVTARDLKAEEAMAILLKDAIKPNLVQTLEGTPAFIHGGPFANIAHGCNSIIATKTALSLSDYVVTEAGFGADLGAEKFFDIKCRLGGLKPSAVVIVATVKALKYNGGAAKDKVKEENLEAFGKGLCNLYKHIENIRNVYNLPCVVAVNRYHEDTDAELKLLTESVKAKGAAVALAEVFAKGGAGGIELAQEVIRAANEKNGFKYCYELTDSYEEKLNKIARSVYGADGVNITDKAQSQLKAIEAAGYGKLPVCIAKTQYSLSDNPSLLGRPEGFSITIKEVKLKSGAGFVVALAGDILLMPGLPIKPNSEVMTIDNDGVIKGLF